MSRTKALSEWQKGTQTPCRMAQTVQHRVKICELAPLYLRVSKRSLSASTSTASCSSPKEFRQAVPEQEAVRTCCRAWRPDQKKRRSRGCIGSPQTCPGCPGTPGCPPRDKQSPRRNCIAADGPLADPMRGATRNGTRASGACSKNANVPCRRWCGCTRPWRS